MKRTKSFSQYGAYLERRNTLRSDQDFLARVSERAKERPLEVSKSEPKFIQGFDRITKREQPSSFQLFHTKDKNTQSNYEVKENMTQTRNAFYPVRRQSEPRLKKLIVNKEKYERNQCPCERMPDSERDQTIMTTRDLQKTRKNFHSIDFEKQLTKSHSYIKKPEGKETINVQGEDMRTTGKVELALQKKDPMNKTQSIHSFGSYTNRDFLSQRKLNKRAAPVTSGADFFKVPPEKFKNNWKTIQPPKFEQVPNKHLNRYDGDYPWHTKLGYHPKEQIVNKKTLVFNMRTHSPRKMNEVHSKYPLRVAI